MIILQKSFPFLINLSECIYVPICIRGERRKINYVCLYIHNHVLLRACMPSLMHILTSLIFENEVILMFLVAAWA